MCYRTESVYEARHYVLQKYFQNIRQMRLSDHITKTTLCKHRVRTVPLTLAKIKQRRHLRNPNDKQTGETLLFCNSAMVYYDVCTVHTALYHQTGFNRFRW